MVLLFFLVFGLLVLVGLCLLVDPFVTGLSFLFFFVFFVFVFLLVFGPFALVGFLVPGLLVLVFAWSYCYFFFGLLVLFGL